ncbi:MAG TPA: cellulose binding domain-containing protein [Pilimelia sp.]|nr:cellulose binding domain-containing protein [Pilimelia sp.]
MNRPLRALLAVGVALAGGVAAVVTASVAQADTQICDQFGSTTIQGRYVVMNNRWGTSAQHCINVTDTGFQILQQQGSNPTNGGPVSYPAVFAGCHYTNCSPGTNMPVQVSRITSATSSISYTYVNNAVYNASYDIWLDPTPRTNGVSAMEIMIWFNRVGPIQPIGSPVGSATIGGRTWEVWRGSNGANNVISYVAPSAIPSWNFSVLDFIRDTQNRGAITSSWYLTSIQAGFEPWQNGAGLAVNSFSAAVSTSAGGNPNPTDSQAPTVPGQPTAGNVTANSVGLSWAASSDNVGVTAYEVLRSQGGGAATPVANVTGTSYTATGLAASTAYTFSVRARDAAGNVSAASPGRTVTTAAGSGGNPGPTGACRVSYRASSWGTGFTADVTITNTGSSAINGWALAWSFPGNQQVTNAWNATISPASGAVMARNAGHNGNLAPGASASFGFQGSYSGTNGTPGSFQLNGSACTTG